MSDKLPPALLARNSGPGRYAPVTAGATGRSWLEYFRLPNIEIPKALKALPTEKKHVYIAASVVAALSMGGFLTWYVYSCGRWGSKKSHSTAKLGIDKIDHSARLCKQNRLSTSDINKNVPDGVLILHQCPRGRRTPCIAPYPLKLETFLRIYQIKYEVDFNSSEPRQADAPWITLDLEDICDSQNCMRFLVDRYSLDLESGFSDSEKATIRAYTHLLENHLYWGIALWRWVYDGARSLSDIQLLPAKTIQMIPQVCKTVEQAAWFHGIGKKTPRDVTEAVTQDLTALANLLGSKPYFFGEKPCELDCTAFAMLAQMIWNMDGSPYERVIKDKHKNLVEFCWRMRTTYWPDWDNCLNNESCGST